MGEGGAWLRWQLRPEARHPAPCPGFPSPHHTGFISTFISLSSMPHFPSILLFSFSFSFVGTHLWIYALIYILVKWSRLLPAGGLANQATLTPGVDDSQEPLPTLPCVFFPSPVPPSLSNHPLHCPPFTGMRRPPGTHLLKGALILDVSGP